MSPHAETVKKQEELRAICHSCVLYILGKPMDRWKEVSPLLSWDKQIEELYLIYSPLLRNLCRKRTRGNPIYEDLIEECIQDVFTVAYKERKMLREVVNMQAWLIRICLNRFIPRLKQFDRKREMVAFSINDPAHEASHPAIDAISQYVEAQEIIEFQRCLLQQMDDIERQVYTYYFEDDITMEAIANKLGLSVNKIRYIIQRIRTKARRMKDNIR